MYNGPGTRDGTGLAPTRFRAQYLRYLNLGLHLAPTGNQDNHYRTWGTLTEARTGVLAPALTKADLLGALKARHVFATLDRNLAFVARARVGGRTYLMGDRVPAPPPGTPFELHYVIHDADEPQADYRIDILADVVGGDDVATRVELVRHTGNTPPGTPGRIEGLTYHGGHQYFVINVFQSHEHGGSDQLWTAPLWFEDANALPAPAGPDPKSFVASRRSGIYHPDPTCRFAQAIAPQNRIEGPDAARGREPHERCGE
jgi:hypothetical protein